MLSTPAGFLALVLGFGFIIFVHELGHFLVAKAVGIKCTQFALGMGPAIFAWRKGLGFRARSTEPAYRKAVASYLRKKGVPQSHGEPEVMQYDEIAHIEHVEDDNLHWPQEQVREAELALGLSETEYRLNWLPLGGYVKMLGQEDMDATAVSSDPRSFSAKPIWARACVISAGVIMNLIFALVFFFVAFSAGVEFPRAVVGRVVPDTPAAAAYAVGHEGDPAYRGLQVGDRLVSVDGDPVTDFMDVKIAAALAKFDQTLEMVVERPSEQNHGSSTLTFRITPRMNEQTKFLTLGIEPGMATKLALVEGDEKELKPGMVVSAVNGVPVPDDAYYQFARAVENARGQPVKTTFSDPASGLKVMREIAAMPWLMHDKKHGGHLLGMLPATRIAAFGEVSPAREAGVEVDDLIAQVGNAPWPAPHELSDHIRSLAAVSPGLVPITVWRNGEQVTLKPIAPTRKKIIGVAPVPALDTSIVGHVLPGSPAAALHLSPGSRITSINGQPVNNWADMQRVLQSIPAPQGAAVHIDVGFKLNVVSQPEGTGEITLEPADLKEITSLGWMTPPMGFDYEKVLIKGDSVADTASIGLVKTQQFVLQTYVTLARLFQGSVKPENLHGPIGIAHVGTRMAKEGSSYFLFFLGLISVNLVVINFLPIPIVDGGLMVFLLIEKLKGSPVSPRVMGAVNIAGLVMLGCIFLMVTYFDLARLLG